MSRQRRLEVDSGTNKPLAIFATILVVIGIVGVAYVSSLPSTSPAPLGSPSATTTAPSSQSSHVDQPQLVLVNENAVSLMAPDGTLERLSVDAFALRTKDHRLPYEGSNVANGSVVLFHASSSPDAPRQFPSTNGTYIATRAESLPDGTGVVHIARRNETSQKIVLRDGKTALKDAEILGWFSDTELAVVVTAAGSRSVYTVRTTAAPRLLLRLPETVVLLTIRAGMLWYATAVQGEGIESPPKGPSEIHRVESSGKNTRMTRDESRVVSSIIPDAGSASERVAYTTEDGQAFVFSSADGTRVALGKKRPLLFLSSGDLIMRDGYDLISVAPESGSIRQLGAVPEGRVEVYDASSLLDANP